MATGLTNRGKYLVLNGFFLSSVPSTFYLSLHKQSAALVNTDNVNSDGAEIATVNGYSAGGTAVARNTTDWPTISQEDSLGYSRAVIKTISFTPSGGPIPGVLGQEVYYAALTDDNATPASRQMIAYWMLNGPAQALPGGTLSLNKLEIRIGR